MPWTSKKKKIKQNKIEVSFLDFEVALANVVIERGDTLRFYAIDKFRKETANIMGQ